jgi:hypothetical protein
LSAAPPRGATTRTNMLMGSVHLLLFAIALLLVFDD